MEIAPLPRGVLELDQSPSFQNAQQLFLRAETEIALIDRTQPLNAVPERGALLADFRRGAARAPRFEYRRRSSFAGLRGALAAAAVALEARGPFGTLYAARARELELEAALAEAIDTPVFAQTAALRYPLERSLDAPTADAWASEWAQADEEPDGALHRSDDLSDPASLFCVLVRAAQGLPVRVELRANQAAHASVGEGFIGVRPGFWHNDREARRIALHEIEGHVRPRVLARRETLGLFRVGSAGSNEDEEGRALLIERRARVLDGARRRGLSRRHMAARSVRRGASFVDSVNELLELGHPLEAAIDAACRAYRGGGLGREYVYLVGLSRVARAFDAQPELERWLKRGRLSLAASRACMAGF